jgi:MFS family permease
LGALICVPIYIFTFTRPTEEVFTVMRTAWCVGAFCHYMYLGSQYTIGQGVVSQRSRASAIAILLLMIALIGNGIGPLFVGWLSDMFMNMEMVKAGANAELTSQLCRNAVEVAKLAADQQSICRGAYAEGLKLSMISTTLFFIPAALFFYLSSRTLHRDMVAKAV